MVMLAAWVATFVLGTQMQPHTATLVERLVDAADTPAKWAHALLWLSRAQMAEFLAVIPFMVSVSTSPLVHSHTATVGYWAYPLPPAHGCAQGLLSPTLHGSRIQMPRRELAISTCMHSDL